MKTFAEFIAEGNPLARQHEMERRGHAFVNISAERKGLSKKENEDRMKDLHKRVKELGYGYRKSEGRWEGGREDSIVVYAKGSGKEYSDKLLHDMKNLGKHYDQDAIIHHDGTEAKLHGTNKTGMGMDATERIGQQHFDQPNEYGITKFRPERRKAAEKQANAKPKDRKKDAHGNDLKYHQPSFTMLDKMRPAHKRGTLK